MLKQACYTDSDHSKCRKSDRGISSASKLLAINSEWQRARPAVMLQHLSAFMVHVLQW